MTEKAPKHPPDEVESTYQELQKVWGPPAKSGPFAPFGPRYLGTGALELIPSSLRRMAEHVEKLAERHRVEVGKLKALLRRASVKWECSHEAGCSSSVAADVPCFSCQLDEAIGDE